MAMKMKEKGYSEKLPEMKKGQMMGVDAMAKHSPPPGEKVPMHDPRKDRAICECMKGAK